MYGGLEFTADVLREFPELNGELEDPDGIHIPMGVLCSVAEESIRSGDLSLFDRIARFVSLTLAKENLDPEIENAVEISFLEFQVLMESKNGRKAFARLPASIQQILQRQNY